MKDWSSFMPEYLDAHFDLPNLGVDAITRTDTGGHGWWSQASGSRYQILRSTDLHALKEEFWPKLVVWRARYESLRAINDRAPPHTCVNAAEIIVPSILWSIQSPDVEVPGEFNSFIAEAGSIELPCAVEGCEQAVLVHKTVSLGSEEFEALKEAYADDPYTIALLSVVRI